MAAHNIRDRGAVNALNKELKRPRPELESGPVAKILIKLSAGVSSLVDGLPS